MIKAVTLYRVDGRKGRLRKPQDSRPEQLLQRCSSLLQATYCSSTVIVSIESAGG